ncbi:MAG: Oxidoreductase FAD-binding domain protein [Ilumatobacteraceae bacterium]|nr:Oxidoreductase FAD-binding domain protein [Ilumatobacteraceae bacterium]
MAEHPDVRREHGFHALLVKAVVEETPDTRTFVVDVPDDLRDLFAYRAGQFCTVRAQIDGDDVLRCYSMSSAPGVDADLAVTVKRVPGGAMSNWLNDNVVVGGNLQLSKPAGTFCPADSAAPVIGFCGGSGITPVLSIAKEILSTTERSVKLLVANRDAASVIFRDELSRLELQNTGRLEVRHHLDSNGGYLHPDTVRDFVAGSEGAEMFICGPTPFMDLVERVLSASGVEPGRIAIERFVAGWTPGAPGAAPVGTAPEAAIADVVAQTLTLIVKGKKHVLDHVAGDTVLDTARRGGVKTPFSCELGNCASCMAMVRKGAATMRANNALTPAEIDEGWVLTCQAMPTTPETTIAFEGL